MFFGAGSSLGGDWLFASMPALSAHRHRSRIGRAGFAVRLIESLERISVYEYRTFSYTWPSDISFWSLIDSADYELGHRYLVHWQVRMPDIVANASCRLVEGSSGASKPDCYSSVKTFPY
jgi:hypothetical protein